MVGIAQSPWMKQMFLKGTKLLASSVYNEMVVNGLSITETADNFSITEAAVNEVVQWCQLNAELLEIEAKKELVLVDNLAKTLEKLSSQETMEWLRRINKGMERTSRDEDYRLEISKKLS